MKNTTHMLSRIIFAALATGAMFSSDPASACDTAGCTVYGPAPYTPPPPPPPCWTCGSPGGGDNGDNSGDGSGEPSPPPDPQACLSLSQSKPDGCTRELATAGQQRPDWLVPDSWSNLMLYGTTTSRQLMRGT